MVDTTKTIEVRYSIGRAIHNIQRRQAFHGLIVTSSPDHAGNQRIPGTIAPDVPICRQTLFMIDTLSGVAWKVHQLTKNPSKEENAT